MANELMKKVGELLEMAGLDQEVVKSVTEKLADEEIELNVDEAKGEKCDPKMEPEDDQHEEEAPVDKDINKGGIDVTEAEEDGGTEDDEVAVPAEDEEGEQEVKESEELVEALHALLGLVQEAYEHTSKMSADFEALKEEYAKLVAEKIIDEALAEEVAESEKEEKEDEAEKEDAEEKEDADKASADDEKAKEDEEKGDKKDAEKEVEKGNKEMGEVKNLMHDEKKDYDKAHCDESLEETANKIAESVEEISEGEVEEPVKKVQIAKAYSVFSSISESAEEKSDRKAFTLFPNL